MRITHDLHTHTFQSARVLDPKASARNLIARAAELGHTVLGISNYLWDSSIPTDIRGLKGQPEKYILEIKHAIPEDTKGVRVLIGAESDYCGLSDTLAVTASTARQFDYILIRHSSTRQQGLVIAEDPNTLKVRAQIKQKLTEAMPDVSEALIDRMVAAIKLKDANEISAPEHDQAALIAEFLHSSLDGLLAHPQLSEIAKAVPTAIIHPFWSDGSSAKEARRILSMLDYDRMSEQFRTCAELGVAIVINTGVVASGEDGYAGDPMVRVIRTALDAGCRVVFGSEAYSLEELDSISKADGIADALGITEDDLIQLVR